MGPTKFVQMNNYDDPGLTFLVSLDCHVALPRGAMGLSTVCGCGIS